jgi:hypothetical protein
MQESKHTMLSNEVMTSQLTSSKDRIPVSTLLMMKKVLGGKVSSEAKL